MVGNVMLQVKDRKELIEKINVRQDGKLLKKINNLNGVKMATVSFEKNIVLDNKSINRLVAVISKQEQEQEHNELKKMNTLNKVERGKEILKHLFSV